ncbi:hypothetical protein [Flavobacterium sp. GSA192]|uniref:DUF922 domain-containing protein n=1 Tax=Flavobacterium sp. GSA192 TaxID=2576304 RepID=UPI00112D1F11|nr:hypothetical protein [Flavobacterium sp. GSA192]
MKINILIILSFIILNSCSPRITPTIISKQNPISDDTYILVLNKDDDFKNDGIQIGTIKSTDKGFSTHCSFDEIIEQYKKICRENGANIIKINEHKVPDLKSSCDRIEATIYKVPNYKIHENTIEWSKERKLTWFDFKRKPASDNYPFGAETSCIFTLKSNTVSLINKPKIKITNSFHCDESWVKTKNLENQSLLEHEQLHFDLSEIYARKLRKIISENKFNSFNLVKESNKLFYEYFDLNKERQILYDKETNHGRDTLEQKKWKKMIETELKQLDEFAAN